MSDFENHCQECQEILGQRFEQVHIWLDELMYDDSIKQKYKSRHRKFRHNRKGIEEVRKMRGDEAAKDAEIHTRTDLRGDGWPDEEPIPKDTREYDQTGLW